MARTRTRTRPPRQFFINLETTASSTTRAGRLGLRRVRQGDRRHGRGDKIKQVPPAAVVHHGGPTASIVK
jgi:hypothetical protein